MIFSLTFLFLFFPEFLIFLFYFLQICAYPIIFSTFAWIISLIISLLCSLWSVCQIPNNLILEFLQCFFTFFIFHLGFLISQSSVLWDFFKCFYCILCLCFYFYWNSWARDFQTFLDFIFKHLSIWKMGSYFKITITPLIFYYF